MDVTRHSYLDSLLLQNEKLNLLTTMTEEVAHEIRNPLVSLGGYARKLRAAYPEAVETEIILQECTRLERLVQRIATYQEPLTVTWKYCSVLRPWPWPCACCHAELDARAYTVMYVFQTTARQYGQTRSLCTGCL